MITFILGSTLVLGAGGEAKQDVWIAVPMAIFAAVPVFFVYARLLTLFPGKDLYEILNTVFGKIVGKLLSLFIIWFAFHLGALVIRNFTEFIKIVSIPETPQNIIAIFMTVLCIWAVKAGVEVIGRWTSMILPIIIGAIIGVTLLFIPLLEFKNLKPVLYEGMGPVLDSAFSVLSFPFAETVIFTTVLNKLRKPASPFKVYYWSLLIGGITIVTVATRSVLVLGVENISMMYFPSYASVRLINIGDFLQRIEVLVSTVFLFAGFVKISICLYAASSGMAKVLNMDDYRYVVTPVGLLMMALAAFVYPNVMEMFEWANKIYKFYAFPFEIILPLIVFIGAEIKIRTGSKKRGERAK